MEADYTQCLESWAGLWMLCVTVVRCPVLFLSLPIFLSWGVVPCVASGLGKVLWIASDNTVLEAKTLHKLQSLDTSVKKTSSF